MRARKWFKDLDRREFLEFQWRCALSLAVQGSRKLAGERSASKPLRGIFPIAQTPFTSDRCVQRAEAK